MLGTIKWFNKTKGFGFITPEDGKSDVFVHITAAKDPNVLSDGNKVIFETKQGKKGIQADNVRQA